MEHTPPGLDAWLTAQRWFTATGDAPRIRVLEDVPVDSADPAARVHILIIVDDAARPPIVYQVPLVERDGEPGFIDGPQDPAYTDALLRAVAPTVAGATAELLTGEQSNTSIIFRPPTGTPIICKLYRRLNAGTNPDIELQSAVAAAGSPHVPRTVGRIDGTWPSPSDPTQTDAGALAFAQEFLPGVEDAWRVALRAAEAGEDFAAAASSLGTATADVHLDLARLFPAPVADAAARDAITGAWERRLAIAVAEVPQLAPHRSAVADRYRAAASGPWPSLQRIHGDYHLGQVLQVPGRGWVLLDFEGEPMRPMAERRAPDLALRDIAGMLRSFDYVAGSLALRPAMPTEARSWAASARGAFLEGYRVRTGSAPAGELLDALELDKAVYEAIYEARHRPDWLSIPLQAIERLVTR